MRISVAIYLDMAFPPVAQLNEVNPASIFATVELADTPGGRAYIALRTAAEAEALAGAATEALRLLREKGAAS